MDVQTQDSVCGSEKEQLSAPSGWTKKLVPASAKSMTLRKHDVVFIAPDGQEVKSKWHLSRYLKAHPDGPAPSEFNWSSGEEAPIRRSTRVAVTSKEDPVVEKSSTKKKGKRNASEMDSEEAEAQKEKPKARKRAKKADESADLDGGAQDAADVPDEVMHEATASLDAAPLEDVQKVENEVTEVEASKEAVTEVIEVEASKEAVTEITEVEASTEAITEVTEVEASTEVAAEKAMDEVVDVQEEVGLNAITEGEGHLTEVTVVEVMEVITERDVHAENELNTEQEETGTPIAPLSELKEQDAMESELPVEHAVHEVLETEHSVKQADDNVAELEEENPEFKFEVNEEVFAKVTMESAVPMASSVVEEVFGTASDPLKQEEEPLGPLEQKDEQERPPPTPHAETKERSPSEYNGSSVPVSVSNQ